MIVGLFEMKRSSKIIAVALLVSITMLIGCARVPSTKRTSHIINTYFKKYGKKYHDTVYGKSHVKEVDVRSIQEIHKHLVAVEAFITMESGDVTRISATIEKGPLGWRFISWENSSGS